jgi:hypothetical protein
MRRVSTLSLAFTVLLFAACAPSTWVVAVVNHTGFPFLIKVETPSGSEIRLVAAYGDGDLLHSSTPIPNASLDLIDPTSCLSVATVSIPSKSSWAAILPGSSPGETVFRIDAKSLAPDPTLLPIDTRCGK